MEISGCSYSDAINSAGSEFDVFLSFRGPDTRNGITDHLYDCMCVAGLRVFRDDEEIRRGEVIGGELERVIANSRVYAIVFSGDYASSAWCLRELAMMVDLWRGSLANRKIILPIFYGADPNDIKLRTKLYRKALDKHKGRYGSEVVKKWEEALVTVGQISGWDSKAIQGNGRFVRSIVQDIMGKLRIKDRSLPVHLTGIDVRVSDMLYLLNCDFLDIRVVVLHGMGGIGKTTLASVVFNQISSHFEGSCFLSNVCKSSTGDEGIEKLKNKLSRDILGVQNSRLCDLDDEGNEIIQRLRGKRLLLILDDVDKASQLTKLAGNDLHWLGQGSRVIITTRERNICNGLIDSGVLYFYEMKKMKDDHALQLFSRHAFGNDVPPEDYVTLSDQVIDAIGNLPLAIEVIGRHLFCQSKESWKHTLEKLKQVPPKEVLEILMISYEGLDFWEREIFLDIACFSEEMPRAYADCLWEARNLYPKCGVMVLVNKSLIKILPDGKFWIHDQLRDMGREIVRLGGFGNPINSTRLWVPEDALDVVLRKEVSEKIIAVNLGRCWKVGHFKAEDFRGLSNLLYLQLTGGKFVGDFKNLRERLMWLSWYDCDQGLDSTIFKMNNLVVLKISGIRTESGHVEKLIMPNLRVLEICESGMTMTPDVSFCLKLKIMSFKNCNRLHFIHRSIGKLENLNSLNISRCMSLTSLPEELGSARALRELVVTHTGLKELPESIKRLESLSLLVLENAEIKKLSTSICCLENLEELNASSCHLDGGIPEEIGRLSALEVLNLQHSKIHQLPTTISHLSSLKSLNIENCHRLRELPDLPASLTKLTFLSRSLQVIPNLSAQTNLTELTLCFDQCGAKNNYEQSPHGMGSQSQPIELSWLGKLHKLKRLHFCLGRRTPVRITTELGSLSRLKDLLLSCPDTASVSQLPSSLCMLRLLDSRTMIPWAYYSNLRLLTRLDLFSLGLMDIQFGGLDVLGSLKTLNFAYCENLQRLSNLASLRSLTSLSFFYCPMLVDIPGLEQLELLERLSVTMCKSIRSIPDLLDLKRLKRVRIICCPSLLRMPRMIDECDFVCYYCGNSPPFSGPYRQYELHGGRESGAEHTHSGTFPWKDLLYCLHFLFLELAWIHYADDDCLRQ